MALSNTRDVLLRVVDQAELLPYESQDARPLAHGHFGAHGHGALIGGLYLVVADGVTSQVLPAPAQPWLAFAAFDHLTATPPAASNQDVARVLARRMAVIELVVRLTMTRAHDWQTQLTHERRYVRLHASPERFRWSSMLRELVGSTWTEPTTQLALMTLRWGHPRFLLEWQHDPIPDDYPLMLEQLLSGVAQDNMKQWVLDPELAALLFAEDTHQPQVRAKKRHRIVELGLAFHHGRVSTSLLFAIVEVLERFGEQQHKRCADAIASREHVSIEFRFTTLRFEHMSSVAGSALEHLGDLVRNSKYLYIEEIKLPRLVREEDRCIQRCLADLTTPAPPSTHATAPVRRRCPTRLRRLACQNDSKSFATFGSVMRYDTAIRELDVYYVPRDMEAVAAWLAFGVFHVDAASQATSLCMRMPGSQHFEELTPPHAICTPQWLEIFQRVLTSVASAQDLAPIDAKTMKSGKRKRGCATDATTAESTLEDVPLPTDACVYVEVKKNTKARAQPLLRSPIVAVLGDSASGQEEDNEEEEDEGDSVRVTRPVMQFQVVRKLRAWLAVAVPGAGAVWIPSNAVTSESTRETCVGRSSSSSSPVANTRITSFSWVGGSMPEDIQLRRQHSDALVALLAIVGRPLEVLQLPCNGLQNAHVAQILSACPNLKELNLAHNDITDISPLLEAYTDGSCKITTLNICQDGEDHARVVQQTSRILELGTEQPDKVTSIERLALRVTPFDEDRIDYYLADVIPPMQRAMFKSPKLEFARIHCDDLDQGNLANEITRLRHQEYMTTMVETAAAAIATAAATTTTPGTTTATAMPTAPNQVVSTTMAMPAAPTVDDVLVSRPLPMRAKLALLSVVRHESMQASALGALDTGVVGLMMQFARTTQMRVVSIAADPPVF